MSKVTVDEVCKRFGLSDSSVKNFLKGEVVTQELEASSDKDLSLLVVAVMGASVEKCWEFIQAERVAEVQAATLASGPIDPLDTSLDAMELDDETTKKLESNPSGLYFLSKAEAKAIKDAIKNGKSALEALREVLAERVRAFWEKGLAGIVPYDGKGRDPQIDLKNANKAALEVLKDPTIRAEVEAVPSKSANKDMHSLGWSIQKGRDLATPTLNHYIRYKRDDGFISVTRRFYSGYDYDSTQIVTGVLPTSDGRSVVFYTNHTYTSKVAGFGGAAKRSVGRKMMVGKLVETMKKGQKELSS